MFLEALDDASNNFQKYENKKDRGRFSVLGKAIIDIEPSPVFLSYLARISAYRKRITGLKIKTNIFQNSRKKEAMRIPEGTKVPISLCVTQSLLTIAYHKKILLSIIILCRKALKFHIPIRISFLAKSY